MNVLIYRTKKTSSHGMSSLMRLNFPLHVYPPHLPLHTTVSLMLYTSIVYISGLISFYRLHQMTFSDNHLYPTFTIYHQPPQPLSSRPFRITWIPLPHLHHRPNPHLLPDPWSLTARKVFTNLGNFLTCLLPLMIRSSHLFPKTINLALMTLIGNS